ncbi:MAG: hypothetical protein ACR2QO_21790 [Acidimicrobiales bacterium]
MARKHRETHTVVLDSGGKISFKLNFRNFQLTERDRELVTHLIDTVRDFEGIEVVEAEETPDRRWRKKRGSPKEAEETEEVPLDPVGVEVS